MSAQNVPPGAVVVGVDGTGKDRRALAWGAAEAARRRTGLHVLYAYPWTVFASEYGIAPSAEILRDASAVTDAAVEEALEAVPGLVVTTQVVVADAAVSLVTASEQASVVVLGARGRGAVAGALLGSVSQSVAAHAHGPVVVIRERGGTPDGPVVAGVEPAQGAAAVLEFAFEQARAHGVGLRAVHAHSLASLRTDYFGPRTEEFLALAAEQVVNKERSAIDALVAAEAGRGVAVEVVDVEGHPVDVLAEEADAASLVVVGSRSRSGLAALRLGSVSRGVLCRAPVVAVVRVPVTAR
ncbi:universal stress protein [Georgenia sp. M64]|jgi:nucleotide-binding universal stress UspA family protein|uniref:universal stress protein n=1 Tax=Georgenia sp. M64 TaxID=3120520 RepID=UPI0030E433EA